jgi:hypothetical protein
MTTRDIALNKLVAVYLKIRTAIQEKEEQQKNEIQTLRDEFDIVGTRLLELCKDQNVDSIRTPAGTVSRRVSSRYWTNDWDSLYKFIKENDAHYLLEKRIHNTNMQQFLEESPDSFPPGLQNDRKYIIQVRKPTAK